MEKEKGPGLTVIDGGIGGKDKRQGKVKAGRVGLAPSGLTLKQEEFARLLSEGATNSEAYRAAYNCDGMAASTVHQEGCKLAAHRKVAERVEALLAAKTAKAQHAAAKAEDRIWRGVWELAEGSDTPPAVKATALGLAARMAGLFADKITVETHASATDIERELAERLARYAK